MAGEEKVRRYRAFITYSHRDRRWANWLHRRLELYRVPRRLVGRSTSAGVITRRLAPIFRDREDLATAGDLGEKITTALDYSDALIIICSPAAARSKWVNEEILRFKRDGREAHVFCLVVGGEPMASENGGDERNECFPPALRHRGGDGGGGDDLVEPLAADVRPGGDGRGLALLKIIAGLLAVDLGELRRRELQRRNRRWAAVAALALVVMIATSLLALEATHQRKIAEQRRAQAEGLVAFMLGNLQSELQPIGRLDLLDMIGKRVLAYYSSQDPGTLDAESLERRARALRLIGEVDFTRGHLDAALSVFRQATATTARLLSLEPDNPDRIYNHGQSLYWMGYVAYERGDLQLAETTYRHYRSLAKHLIRINPKNAHWQGQLFEADSDLGIVLLNENKVREASDLFRRSLAIASTLENQSPGSINQFDIAQNHAYIADAEEQLGRLATAYKERSIELGIYRKILSKDPANNNARSGLAACKRALARLEIGRGHPKAALALIKDGITVANGLVTQNPGNTIWQEIDARSYVDLGEALYDSSKLDAASKAASKAENIARTLIKKDPTVIAWQTNLLARNQLLKARIAAREKRHESALGLVARVIEKLSKLPARMQSSQTVETLLIEARLIQGEELQALGKDGSAESWEAALAIGNVHPGNQPLPMQTYLALVYFHLGQTRKARRIVDQLDADGYLAPEFKRIKTLVFRKHAETLSANSSPPRFNRPH